MYTFTKKEMELMQLFWKAGRALGRQEILDLAAVEKCSWKPSSIHIMVNSVLKKGAVQAVGYHLYSRKLGRLFQAILTPEEYANMQVAKALFDGEELTGIPAEKLLQNFSLKDWQKEREAT